MNNTFFSKFVHIYENAGIAILLVIELIFFGLKSDQFFKVANLMIVGRQISFTGIAAVGITTVLLVGEIDISIGSILAFSGCLAAFFNTAKGMGLVPAFILVLLICALFGLCTGTLVSFFKIPSLISTLAMQQIIKGCTYLLTKGRPIPGISDNFKFLGQGFLFGGIPVPFAFMLIMFVIGFIVLEKTYIGRHLYGVGGNKEAARLSGIGTKKVVLMTFIVAGVLAGFSGILMAGRLGTGQPSTGSDFAMDVLTAVVLGGVSLSGGKGKIVNVLLGVIIIGILSNGLVMIGVVEYWQWIIKGIVFLFAVAMSQLNEYRISA